MLTADAYGASNNGTTQLHQAQEQAFRHVFQSYT